MQILSTLNSKDEPMVVAHDGNLYELVPTKHLSTPADERGRGMRIELEYHVLVLKPLGS